MTDDVIRRYTFRQIQLQNLALSKMAERMLTDERGIGIAMIQHPENTVLTLEDGIPFGHIYEFPSEESYLLWIAHGRPS